MTIEEIRNSAPDGATHYRVREFGGICYYKEMNGIYVAMDGSLRFSQPHHKIKPLY